MGGYGHYTKTSFAMGYVEANTLAGDTHYEVEVLGEPRSARVQLQPLHDPTGERMRS